MGVNFDAVYCMGGGTVLGSSRSNPARQPLRPTSTRRSCILPDTSLPSSGMAALPSCSKRIATGSSTQPDAGCCNNHGMSSRQHHRTGTRLTGRVFDRNGPWLAEQLRLTAGTVEQVVRRRRRPRIWGALRGADRPSAGTHPHSGGLGPPRRPDCRDRRRGAGRRAELDPELGAGSPISWPASPPTGVGDRSGGDGTWHRKQAIVRRPTAIDDRNRSRTDCSPAIGRWGHPSSSCPVPHRSAGNVVGRDRRSPVLAALAGRTELRQETLRLWARPSPRSPPPSRAGWEAGRAGDRQPACDGELEIVTGSVGVPVALRGPGRCGAGSAIRRRVFPRTPNDR